MDLFRLLYVDGMAVACVGLPTLLVAMAVYTRIGERKTQTFERRVLDGSGAMEPATTQR